LQSLPQTTAEQRASIYQNVRALLNPGFLGHVVVVNGTRLALRSLNENDWTLLKYRVDERSPVNWKRWAVATSIWMVEGQIVVGDEGVLYRVYQMCSSLPYGVLDDLYNVLSALMRNVREATERAEAFLYEDESRYLWKSEGSRLVGSGQMGIGGIGLNAVQKLWLYYNRLEDDGVKQRQDWELAKFVAGPHVPKGIKKINAKDKQTLAEMKRRRQGVLDRVYYEAQGILSKKKDSGKVSKRSYEGWKVQIAETEEELQDEMRRWVAGIKDPHDNVIDYVKSKIKTEKETAAAKGRAQQAALQKALEEEGITKPQLIPMTGRAAQNFLDRVRARVPGTSKVTSDSSHNSAYEKYIKNNPQVGLLSVDEEGNIVSSEPVNPEEALEVLRRPDEGEPNDLQSLIANRRPSLDSFEEEDN